jgi:hypothetical protein
MTGHLCFPAERYTLDTILQMKRKQTQSSDSLKAAKRVLRPITSLEIDIAENERKLTIALGHVNDGCSICDAAKTVGVLFKTVA